MMDMRTKMDRSRERHDLERWREEEERMSPEERARLHRELDRVEAMLRRLEGKATRAQTKSAYACDGVCDFDALDPLQTQALVNAGLAHPSAAVDVEQLYRSVRRAVGGPEGGRSPIARKHLYAKGVSERMRRAVRSAIAAETGIVIGEAPAGKAMRLDGPPRDEWDRRFDRRVAALAAVRPEIRSLADEGLRAKALDAAHDVVSELRGSQSEMESAARKAVAQASEEHERAKAHRRSELAQGRSAAALEEAVRAGKSAPPFLTPTFRLVEASIVADAERREEERLARLAAEREALRRAEDERIDELRRRHLETAPPVAVLGLRLSPADGTIVGE
jgi:hypothetical protein